MSDAVIFNTHRFVKRMTEAGMASPVAEALAEEHVQLLEKNLATKTDIALIQAKIEEFRASTQKETTALIASAQLKIVLWLSGVVLGTGALLVAVLK